MVKDPTMSKNAITYYEKEYLRGNPEILDDCYEERAAILEYDAGYSRYNAEQLAAQMYGFKNKSDLKKWIQMQKANTSL